MSPTTARPGGASSIPRPTSRTRLERNPPRLAAQGWVYGNWPRTNASQTYAIAIRTSQVAILNVPISRAKRYGRRFTPRSRTARRASAAAASSRRSQRRLPRTRRTQASAAAAVAPAERASARRMRGRRCCSARAASQARMLTTVFCLRPSKVCPASTSVSSRRRAKRVRSLTRIQAPTYSPSVASFASTLYSASPAGMSATLAAAPSARSAGERCPRTARIVTIVRFQTTTGAGVVEIASAAGFWASDWAGAGNERRHVQIAAAAPSRADLPTGTEERRRTVRFLSPERLPRAGSSRTGGIRSSPSRPSSGRRGTTPADPSPARDPRPRGTDRGGARRARPNRPWSGAGIPQSGLQRHPFSGTEHAAAPRPPARLSPDLRGPSAGLVRDREAARLPRALRAVRVRGIRARRAGRTHPARGGLRPRRPRAGDPELEGDALRDRLRHEVLHRRGDPPARGAGETLDRRPDREAPARGSGLRARHHDLPPPDAHLRDAARRGWRGRGPRGSGRGVSVRPARPEGGRRVRVLERRVRPPRRHRRAGERGQLHGVVPAPHLRARRDEALGVHRRGRSPGRGRRLRGDRGAAACRRAPVRQLRVAVPRHGRPRHQRRGLLSLRSGAAGRHAPSRSGAREAHPTLPRVLRLRLLRARQPAPQDRPRGRRAGIPLRVLPLPEGGRVHRPPVQRRGRPGVGPRGEPSGPPVRGRLALSPAAEDGAVVTGEAALGGGHVRDGPRRADPGERGGGGHPDRGGRRPDDGAPLDVGVRPRRGPRSGAGPRGAADRRSPGQGERRAPARPDEPGDPRRVARHGQVRPLAGAPSEVGPARARSGHGRVGRAGDDHGAPRARPRWGTDPRQGGVRRGSAPDPRPEGTRLPRRAPRRARGRGSARLVLLDGRAASPDRGRARGERECREAARRGARWTDHLPADERLRPPIPPQRPTIGEVSPHRSPNTKASSGFLVRGAVSAARSLSGSEAGSPG